MTIVKGNPQSVFLWGWFLTSPIISTTSDNPPSEDVKDLLVSVGAGVFAAPSGWSIHVGGEPAEPDTTITVSDSGGSDPNPKYLIDEQTVQVRIRSAKVGDVDTPYQEAYDKAKVVKDALLGLPSQTINGTFYAGFWMNGDINSLGLDDNGRFLLTLNFRVVREPASGTNRTAV